MTRMTLGGIGMIAILTAGSASAQFTIDEPFVCPLDGTRFVVAAGGPDVPAARTNAEQLARTLVDMGTLSGFEVIACRGPFTSGPPFNCRVCGILAEDPPPPVECAEEGVGTVARCVGDPIIFDFGERGFHLTGIDQGVEFDIDADGALEKVAWTAPGSADAFLALDRNANGTIDDGNELFGNVTVLGDGSTSAHGYMALAELDLEANGGNGNGHIDRGDREFGSLRLWTDRNHDGRAAGDELIGLRERGILAIGLEPDESDVVDEYGNHLAYVSPAYAFYRFRFQRIRTTDVFFRYRELTP